MLLLVEKLACPGRAPILPEVLEVFIHQVSPDEYEVLLQNLRQLDGLFVGQMCRWVATDAPRDYFGGAGHSA